jgi:hypothetical protein
MSYTICPPLVTPDECVWVYQQIETKAVETRWRGMTVRYSFAISPHLSREFCLNVPPSETKGAGNAGRPTHPQPRV